jgi:hypothetical protein
VSSPPSNLANPELGRATTVERCAFYKLDREFFQRRARTNPGVTNDG